MDTPPPMTTAAASRKGGLGREALGWMWIGIVWLCTAGFSVSSLIWIAFAIPTFGIAYLVEVRTVRPLRSVLRLAGLSALLFLFLVVGVANREGEILLSAIMWLGMTIAGAIWVIYIELIEPRRQHEYTGSRSSK